MTQRWIVLSFDGLANLALGSYGSSWNSTPELDRLAAAGVIWDRAVVASEDLADTLTRLWTAPMEGGTWVDACHKRGAIELILSRDPAGDAAETTRLADVANSVGIDSCTVVEVESSADPAEEPELTILGQMFAALIDRLGSPNPVADRSDDWAVLWLHSDFLIRQWDAPRWLFPIDDEDEIAEPENPADEWLEPQVGDSGLSARGQIAETPPPLMGTVCPPACHLDAESHPDWATTWMQTYGCQIRLIDHWIGCLLDLLAEDGRRIGIAILGTSGFALGQGGCVGHRVGPIISPQIHVPVMIHTPGMAPLRWPALESLERVTRWLVPQVDHVAPPLTGLASPPAWADAVAAQDTLIQTTSPRAAKTLTTHEWFFVRQHDGRTRMFLKPDDRDDVNDIADRCPEIVAEFEGVAVTPTNTQSTDFG
ncbi:MAG: hypothetical protein EHM77_01310 [Planctomycetaceae bacterium]|nr:MAG: hypothetical protein EHM77_01310 [Planctomycetaceae bacterium]